ncbi:MAG TPA: YkgJ family cysteine cluster protein [Blastocatellia bacterium]|nr:YkgJ family cysteine cluster protein [Blastocatellia bacterium]
MPKTELPILTQKKPRPAYDCAKCPGYCCSYDWIVVYKRDINRLARGFGITPEEAELRFTKWVPEYGYRVLRHKQDHIFKSTCMFFDQEKRRCTVYKYRPGVCREYPLTRRCGYFDFLTWERDQQDDEEYIPLMR